MQFRTLAFRCTRKRRSACNAPDVGLVAPAAREEEHVRLAQRRAVLQSAKDARQHLRAYRRSAWPREPHARHRSAARSSQARCRLAIAACPSFLAQPAITLAPSAAARRRTPPPAGVGRAPQHAAQEAAEAWAPRAQAARSRWNRARALGTESLDARSRRGRMRRVPPRARVCRGLRVRWRARLPPQPPGARLGKRTQRTHAAPKRRAQRSATHRGRPRPRVAPLAGAHQE
jgi:hypothetical protein